MCRGIHETNRAGSCKERGEDSANGDNSNVTCCELCGSRATLYCLADDAYLCNKCDKWVHGANFLALRHMRSFLCNICQNLTHRCLVGASYEVMLPSIASLGDRTLCSSVVNINVVVEEEEEETEYCSGSSPKLPFHQFL